MTDQSVFETSTIDRARDRAEPALLREEKQQRQTLRSLRREELQIREMISKLDHAVIILDLSIAAELEVARERNPSHRSYPILATTLTARRDNLKVTIVLLVERLATVKQALDQFDAVGAAAL